MKKNIALREQDNETYEMPVDEAIELARGHHMAGNFILAERTYHDILRAVPESPTVNHLLGALYFQLGNYVKALEYMKYSVELEPNEKQYWSNYGSVYYMIEALDEAIDCYDKALACEPQFLEALNRKSLALWHKENYEEARKIALQSLDIAPDNLEGLINLGLIYSKEKKYQDASDTWKKAGELYPADARIWSNWSNLLRTAHHYKEAEAVVRKGLDLAPEDTDALNNLGCILREMGRSEEALEAFKKATDITPKNYQAHYNAALTLHDMNRYEDAAVAARYAVNFKEDYVDGYNALSAALVEIGQFGQAHFAAQKALQLKPDSADSYINLANVLYLAASFDDGHAALKEALKRDPDNARAYAKLANIYERLDEVDDAIWAIDKAIELAPHQPGHIARKASMLYIANETDLALKCCDEALKKNKKLLPAYITKAEILVALNKTDEAKECLEKAKAIDPHYPLIYFTLAGIKKFEREDDEDLQMMLKVADKVSRMGTLFTSSLYFALAKAFENIKQYDRAFEYLNIANAERRKTLPMDEKHQIVMFEKMKSDFTPNVIQSFSGNGYESEVPIFIVGMPRSGTTLTEQIISSHPDVFGAGELPDVMRVKRRIVEISPETLKEAGKTYVELSSARDKSGKAKRITDKMPGNYMNIGLIALMLPKAKIIHCRRNPMDTCLSNYKQNFMVGQYWSYNLKELGTEYLRYLDLMAYWHKHFPGRILDIDYEETVNDLEAQARKLIDYVGLEWNDACLKPHKQERAVLTASKSQVTKPVYTSSVQKWKRYEDQLKPLYDVLVAGGIKDL